MTKTPNLNLFLPDFNDSPWHDEVNNNFRSIDAVIKSIFGLTSLLGSYQNSTAVTTGQRYFDETTGFYYEALSDFTTMASPNTFADERTAYPSRWILLDASVAIAAAAAAAASETAAAASETAAAASETNAAASESAAATSETNAATSETNAAASAVAALNSSAIGMIQWFGANTAPTGFLKCNGAAISRTTYANLFAVIGTTFGVGDGSTTFNIPDLRGEFIRGWDDSRGVDASRAFGSAQVSMVVDHTHRSYKTLDGAPLSNGGTPYDIFAESGAIDSSAYTGLVTPGFGAGSETRPRNIALLACIKY